MSDQPLHGLRVLDAATLFAGPVAAMLLGDFGAEVIKIEHPKGDAARTHGGSKDGVSLWWKMFGRNKRTVSLNLSRAEGQDIFRRLARTADIVIENFRPGTFERWGLSYEELSRDNPGLILVRVTGFGQFGPYAARPGFGTLAEAMSGFAAITGSPDGPPTLPPFGLADGVTGISAAFAAMTAVHARQRTGLGQEIDIALIEPLMMVLGPQAIMYDQLGVVQQRTGNRSSVNAPRNAYRTSDGRWLAISTSSHSIAVRLMRLVGAGHVVDEPWFASAHGRVAHVELLDGLVAKWVAARPAAEVIAAMEAAEAAVAPVYSIADIFEDSQYKALDTITEVEDPELGRIRMQNVLFRLSRQQGRIRYAGRSLGADNEAIFGKELGMPDDELETLRAQGVI
ncbi:CaiB/BaiF CoA transferase family protein [Novosphingobium mathurense]|uniref:Formyl-CoA transferase n=1 Tax=Novosphingobium mathurense TaxID=428990 RepID=A0A1U6ILB6_9SPHN|nr:CoA transferase [Novosphingobium mathurense]SLK08752.1 formyl-CoA transferase [Novosphingobium mathurense]